MMTDKEKLVGRLLESKSINFEEALLLLQKDIIYQSFPLINYDPYPYPYPTYCSTKITN